MSNPSKSLKIKETIAANKIRRVNMDIKVFSVKVDESHLSTKRKKLLEDCFLQAKWIYNHLIGLEDGFSYDYKNNNVDVMVFNEKTQKCDITENRKITIGSQIKQALVDRFKQNIINLSKVKRKGLKVGKLKFVKEISSIPLKQFGVTFKIKGQNHICIQGVGKLRVRGLEQIKGEIASAVLFKNANGFFVKITCYVDRENIEKNGAIGLDFGIKNSIVDSNGNKFDFKALPQNNLKRQCRILSRKKRGSRKYVQQQKRLKKLYEKQNNKKDDAANKFVNSLKKYEKVIIQDENLRGWHSGLFGKSVQNDILGRIKSKIKRLETSVVINRFLPTTKISPLDGKLLNIKLSDREFIHNSFSEDRDVKSAKTILCFGLYNPKLTREELMGLPVEELTSVFSNYKFENTSQSVEAGSLNPLG